MRILSVLLVACCAWGVERTAVAAPSKPVHTNKSRFRIPYNFDPAEMRRLAAKEIRLYMSTDRGGRWELIQSVPPETGRFNFQAVRDGEYWFSVRTLDGQGRLHPSDEAVEPGLQVIVDTAKPRLSLILRETTPGRVQLAWSAVDEALDVAKLRLEFIQPGSTNWQTMGVVPKAADQTEWSVPQGGVVAVRGSVADLAGNLGESQTQVSVTAGAGPPGTPDFKQPIAGREDPPLAMTDRFPSAAQYPRGTVEQTRVLGDIDAALADGTMSRNSLVSLRQGSFPENAPAEPPKAVDPRVRFVNSRNFQIAYKVQDVGPSGISGVELFITTDHGAKWYRYGEDEDRQSPFQVQVPREGTYGFALLVRSGVGLGSEPPQPGERPGIVLVVDETPPRAQLEPLEQGRGSELSKILIRWTSSEDNPASNGVSLAYAANPAGPWQPIAGNVPDSGSFVWTVGSSVPSKFYLRLEIRDAAGNVGRVETPQPTLIDLSRPTAKFMEIEVGPQ